MDLVPDPDAAQNDERVEAMIYHAGHYAAAVAEHLLRHGIAVTNIGVFEPWEGPQQDLHDVGIDIDFTRAVQESIAKVGREYSVSLGWDAMSGWMLYRGENDGPGEQERWLGQGLAPTPGRVESFVLAGQIDFEAVGSDERPYYREADDDYTDLLARLAPYLEEPDGDPVEWERRWERFRNEAYTGAMIKQLVTDRPDPVLAFPLRASEVRVLGMVLEWAESAMDSSGVGILDALARDLSRREPGDPGSAERQRSALNAARAQHGPNPGR